MGGSYVGGEKKFAKKIGGEFLGKSKKKVWENFGGVKQIFRGQFLEKFQKKIWGGILGGKLCWGRVVGEECWEIKKKLWKFGGEFLGKSKKKVWGNFWGEYKKNLRGAIFGKISKKNLRGEF